MAKGQTRTGEVMAAIRNKVANRALVSGDRLPSVRQFASIMGVSPSTVVEAYDRLAAEGFIRARRGSGFYVTGAALPPMTLSEISPRRDQAVDPFWVSRQSLDADSKTLKPGCGWLPSDWMPNDALRRALRALARADEHLLCEYGSTRGSLALRRLLLGRLAEEGLEASLEQTMLTATGTQAIDLICRLLLRPGDTVLIDDPGYFNFQALLRAHPVKIVGVPYTPAGPDLEAFEQVLRAERPRLYITNSALHNPTGATLSARNAHRLLSVATAHDLTIVEDDIFADFEPEPSPRLVALDGINRVIRIGSFSKTLSASLRCGYVVARPDWIEGLVDLQVATNFGGPSPVATELISHMLSGGSYRRHMEDLRQRLARSRRVTASRLEGLGIKPWVIPRGGFYLWCRLPEGLDSAKLAALALEANVVLAPGNVFSISQNASSFMRINVAQFQSTRVLEVLQDAIKTAVESTVESGVC